MMTTTTYDKTKAGEELEAGTMYYRKMPDGSDTWFTVAAKKKEASGQISYAIISVTYGLQFLKDTHENYKQLRMQCKRWDTVQQCVIEDEPVEVPEESPVRHRTIRSIETELGI